MTPVTPIRSHIPNPSRRGLIGAGLTPLFAAAGLLIYAPATFSAEPGGDAQSQASSLLIAARASEATGASRPDEPGASGRDAQEQARSLLLSIPAIHTNPTRTASRESRSLSVPAPLSPRDRRPDAQASARALILGQGV